jgi:hypothetical protein
MIIGAPKVHQIVMRKLNKSNKKQKHKPHCKIRITKPRGLRGTSSKGKCSYENLSKLIDSHKFIKIILISSKKKLLKVGLIY